MEINFFLIVFVILMVILIVFFPISGYHEMKKLKKSIAEGNSQKVKFYRDSILWAWIPIVLILLLIPLSDVGLDSIGIKWIQIDTFSFSKWFVYPTIGFYILHLTFNIYSIIIFRFNEESRAKAEKNIPDDLRWFLPVTQKEKSVWRSLSVSAGITEELLYRGYLFYALAIVFPSLALVHILFISTLIFGIVHIYLGKEAIKSTLLGLAFGTFYIVFNSVIPVIIVHITQDLVAKDILKEKTS